MSFLWKETLSLTLQYHSSFSTCSSDCCRQRSLEGKSLSQSLKVKSKASLKLQYCTHQYNQRPGRYHHPYKVQIRMSVIIETLPHLTRMKYDLTAHYRLTFNMGTVKPKQEPRVWWTAVTKPLSLPKALFFHTRKSNN